MHTHTQNQIKYKAHAQENTRVLLLTDRRNSLSFDRSLGPLMPAEYNVVSLDRLNGR